MVKYIVKRLFLSIIILLGVSVIIYFLARLMPTDYLETKFSQQLTMGTITQDQVDQFKKDAGLYMPDGYLTLTVEDDVEEFGGLSFVRDVKSVNYDRVMEENMFAHELYRGTYRTDDELWRLDIQKDQNDPNSSTGQYVIYKYLPEDELVADGTYSAADAKLELTGLSVEVSFSAEELAQSAAVFPWATTKIGRKVLPILRNFWQAAI